MLQECDGFFVDPRHKGRSRRTLGPRSANASTQRRELVGKLARKELALAPHTTGSSSLLAQFFPASFATGTGPDHGWSGWTRATTRASGRRYFCAAAWTCSSVTDSYLASSV